ncbi:MAG: sigma-54-dependent Fis family transcriptional regulator [Cryobacterium sp.]|nr:sigma-54-dependent Fis family transcriptional regulator [Oligoflexia bacterium]
MPPAAPLTTALADRQLNKLNTLSIGLQGLLTAESFQDSLIQLMEREIPEFGIQFWSAPSVTRREGGTSEDQTPLSPRDAVLAYVFQKRTALYLESIPSEVRDASPLLSPGAKSVHAIPVQSEKEFLGILVVEATESLEFTEGDEVFFGLLAQQIHSVLKNRLVFNEAKAFAIDLQSVVQEKSIELRRAHEHIVDQQKDLQKENKALKTLIEAENRGQDFIGESPATKEVLSMVDKVAPTLATVLILGESGTGKELIAKRIHQRSSRAKSPYVTVNCAALQESLLESELFGHEKGSFTGAVQTKIGLCEVADGGTLFLDEIGEMTPQIQTKMLRFLQEGEFYRVGGKKPIRVNVRIVSATNRDLAEEVKSGRFREDLYYRLNTIALKVPPLRSRKEDIASLCDYFIKNSRFGGASHVKRIDPRVMTVFENYSWPGNIRELQNTIERLKILADGPEIKLEDIPQGMRAPKDFKNTGDSAIGTPLEEVEKGHILRTLAYHQGNKTKTAGVLGITIKTLYNKLHRYDSPASPSDP